MDYGKLVNRSFEISWRYKFLWFFGMLVSWDAFNIDTKYLVDQDKLNFADYSDIQSFFNSDVLAPLLAGLMLAGILWILIMAILSTISEGALIDSVNRIERGGQHGFGVAWSSGLKFFWRILGIGILTLIVSITYLGVTVTAIVFAFIIHKGLGVIAILFALPISFIAIFVLTNLFSLSQRVVVIRDCSISDSLYEGYYLLKKNLGKNFMIFLISIGIGIAFGIVIALTMLMVGLPIGILLAQLGLSKILAFAAAFVAALPISFLLGGFTGSFHSSLYTLFYLELVVPQAEIVTQTPPPASGIPPAQ